jgi:hypothetical protein
MNIEIARSYSEKLNLGNYCTSDYFCSAKCECDEKEADQKSQELYEFCVGQVKKNIEEYKFQLEKDKQPKETKEVSSSKPLKFDNIKLNGD